jgi:hypothetical protein
MRSAFSASRKQSWKNLAKRKPHDTAVVADRHNSEEEQDPDPDPLQVWKSDPDPHQSDKADPEGIKVSRGIRIRINVMRIRNTNYRLIIGKGTQTLSQKLTFIQYTAAAILYTVFQYGNNRQYTFKTSI